MARGGHGLIKVSPRPAILCASTPCGRATPYSRFTGGRFYPFGNPTPYAPFDLFTHHAAKGIILSLSASSPFRSSDRPAWGVGVMGVSSKVSLVPAIPYHFARPAGGQPLADLSAICGRPHGESNLLVTEILNSPCERPILYRPPGRSGVDCSQRIDYGDMAKTRDNLHWGVHGPPGPPSSYSRTPCYEIARSPWSTAPNPLPRILKLETKSHTTVKSR
jgi:hypothetical protein